MYFRSSSRARAGALAVAAVLALGACDDVQSPVLGTPEISGTAVVDQDALRQSAAEEVGRLVALAFGEPSARGIFRQAMARSTVGENKLFLASFLNGEGTPVLKAMARAGNRSEAEVASLIGQAGPLEIYLPVAEHRARWSGGDELLVAVTLKDHVAPAGFDLSGRRVQLSADKAPATPTVAIVKSEAFDSTGTPHRVRHHAGNGRTSTAAGPRLATTADPWTGLWVTHMYIYNSGQYEGWALGAPEFEMHVERASDRAAVRCAANDVMEPFSFNQDGDNYSNDFLILWDGETPTLEDRLYTIVEDDSHECVLRPKADYTKKAVDWLKAIGAAAAAVSSKDPSGIMVSFYHLAIATRGLWDDDEWVGVVASSVTMDGTERKALIKSESGADRGYVMMQWKTDYGQ